MLGEPSLTDVLAAQPQPAVADGALTRTQWIVLAAAFLGWMFDGVEIGLFPLVSRPGFKSFWGTLETPMLGGWNGIIVAAFLLGAAWEGWSSGGWATRSGGSDPCPSVS